MSPSPDRQPRFDPQALQRLRRMAGDEVMRAVIEAFGQSAPVRMRRAAEAVERGDPQGVREALHSLVSSAGQLGGVELERLCRAGIRQAEKKDALDATVRQVESALEKFLQYLRDAGEPTL